MSAELKKEEEQRENLLKIINVDREVLGELVREIWIECAKELPNPKSSHLIPWNLLDDWNKEVDRRIGEGIAIYLIQNIIYRESEYARENKSEIS